MAVQVGTVVGLNRTQGLASVLLDGRDTPTPCSYMNTAPPPRSRVLVDQILDSQWVVTGSLTPWRQVFKDDFQFALGPVTLGLIPMVLCDQMWISRSSGTPVYSENALNGSGYAQRSGQIGITCASAFLNWAVISKSIAANTHGWIVALGAYWMRFVIASHDTSSTVIRCGVGDVGLTQQFQAPAAGSRAVMLEYETSFDANWQFRCWLDTGDTRINTGVPVVVDRFHDVDILVLPGLSNTAPGSGVAMCWIDGAHVATASTNVPAYASLSGTALMSPWAGVLTGSGARSVILDVFEVSIVGNEKQTVDLRPLETTLQPV